MALTLGLKPMQPQKLAGRRTEPITCVPSAALTMPAATAAAEPLEEPPGVCAVFHGLRVPRGSEAANSVVTVLPTITAPASRSARTLAASFSERQPWNSGEPICVGMSKVSITSLMPIGMPSIGDNGRPPRQRSVARSAAARAAGRLVQTNAPMRGSQASSNSSDCSRNCRGAAAPEAKFRVAARYGRIAGLVCSRIPPVPSVSCRSRLTLFPALVVIMNLVEQAAAIRFEWAVINARRSARIGRRFERLAAPALRVIADDQIAGNQINFLPVVVHERRRGVDARSKPQQPRSAAHLARFVEIAGQDLLLNAGWV